MVCVGYRKIQKLANSDEKVSYLPILSYEQLQRNVGAGREALLHEAINKVQRCRQMKKKA